MAVLGTGAAGDPARPELTHAEWEALVEAEAQAAADAAAQAKPKAGDQ